MLRQYCDRYGMQSIILLRNMHRKPRPGLPRLFDRPQYKKRNVIERIQLAQGKTSDPHPIRQAGE